jgi:predicted ATPase/class 3 adenylate cyclase/DNA-binding CsgD family transcriptional regulator
VRLTVVDRRPSGTVTFFFTDIEGSTASWEQRPDDMRVALALHDSVLRSVIAAHGGHTFSTGGDGFAVAFDRAEDALETAIEGQCALTKAAWPEELALAVRMGLHSGEAQERDEDYFGAAVNRAARVMDAANGSQILVSGSTREVLGPNQPPDCRWIDLGIHELRDVLDPVRLYRVESPEFDSDPRPPRAGSVRAGNLPATSAPLVGRDEDIDAVVADLVTSRFVTLTGVGGIGKTRLALAVGHRLQPQHGDGVWLAALDTVDRPDALVPALLGLFGIEARTTGDVGSLLDGLRFRDTLLILDNCEHLLDSVATIAAAILSSCPQLRVLATPREPLDIEGERVRRVRPLSLESNGSAAALFRLRAEEAGGTVDRVDDEDDVLQICRRLDGIPLALELAAARTRSLRPAEIATRLDDMFRLLTGDKRATAERHRTLRATLEWSYAMLSDTEQDVLARLSMFAGSFALDAVAPVAGRTGAHDDEVVDVVDHLVSRSLLVPVDAAAETRFRLLEPVRQLGAEKLAGHGDTDATRARHTDWYLGVMDSVGAMWRADQDQAAWPMAMRDLPNLRAAFEHLIEDGRVDDAERFVVAAYGPIGCQFDVAPLYEWAPAARALAPDHNGPFTASVCAIAAWGATARGEFDTAAMWLRRGVDAIAAGSPDDGFVSAAAIHTKLSGGPLAVSDEFLERSITSALESNDLHRQIWVLTYAGRVSEAVDLAGQLGNRTLIALAHSRAAPLAPEGRDDARELFWEAAQECHSFILRNHAAMELGGEQIRSGSPLDGLLLLRAPLRDWLLRGDMRVWSVLHAIAVGFATLGDVEAAARFAGAIGDHPLPFVPRSRLATLDRLLGDGLDVSSRARHEAGRATLDAGAAVTEALERIEQLADAHSNEGTSIADDAADLTTRQQEVAGLVARGLTNKQIANRLGISRYTAETHVRNILERLGAASRAEIATWYARQPAAGSGMPVST